MKPWLVLLIMPMLWLSSSRAQNDGAPIPGYPPIEQFEEIMARPLFDDTRRPREDEAGTEENISASAAAIREKWRLSGVVWENDQQLALFNERRGEGRARINTGMYLDGDWQLEEIGRDSATLSDGGQTLRLELWEPRPPSTRPDAIRNNPNEANAAPNTPSAETTEADNKQGSNEESQ